MKKGKQSAVHLIKTKPVGCKKSLVLLLFIIIFYCSSFSLYPLLEHMNILRAVRQQFPAETRPELELSHLNSIHSIHVAQEIRRFSSQYSNNSLSAGHCSFAFFLFLAAEPHWTSSRTLGPNSVVQPAQKLLRSRRL